MPTAVAVIYGPRGIRTLDLLNAIETRSQLRYGPLRFSQRRYFTRNQKIRQLGGELPITAPVLNAAYKIT